jgi:hypothetical protein
VIFITRLSPRLLARPGPAVRALKLDAVAEPLPLASHRLRLGVRARLGASGDAPSILAGASRQAAVHALVERNALGIVLARRGLGAAKGAQAGRARGALVVPAPAAAPGIDHRVGGVGHLAAVFARGGRVDRDRRVRKSGVARRGRGARIHCGIRGRRDRCRRRAPACDGSGERAPEQGQARPRPGESARARSPTAPLHVSEDARLCASLHRVAVTRQRGRSSGGRRPRRRSPPR